MEEIAIIEPAIEKACKAEVIFSQDEINRRKYELREKYQRDRIAEIDYAVNQAVTQAVTQVRAEENEKMNQAISAIEEKYIKEEEDRVVKLIKKGKSFEDIMDFTSLPQERVQQLFDEHHS